MDNDLKLGILKTMVTARCLEERMIKMAKSSDGYFWIGGAGEEAVNVPLGYLAKKGCGLDYDYFYFHYRNSGTMLAMGMDPKDEIRQMNNRATDPFSGGRNFCNHYARKDWNVMPVCSTIQTQCCIAPGIARAQKRHDGDGITIVTAGDAGTAEGDFHVGLNWSTLPEWELPILWIITNNEYGISTSFYEVRGEPPIADYGKAYGIPGKKVNGFDVEESYNALKEAMEFVRTKRRPFLLEVSVARLFGHSSSSGANRVPSEIEPDPLELWMKRCISDSLISRETYDKLYKSETKRMASILDEVKKEPAPEPESIYNHIFSEGE
ncbi:MAG: 3-methyl-2-oxobutanoate dehydrogenase [Acidobacteria bacterium]|nr:MAG: 3-methyl-2-oxobutanoate dehydrogenase [Acidobacteriota bacterium]